MSSIKQFVTKIVKIKDRLYHLQTLAPVFNWVSILTIGTHTRWKTQNHLLYPNDLGVYWRYLKITINYQNRLQNEHFIWKINGRLLSADVTIGDGFYITMAYIESWELIFQYINLLVYKNYHRLKHENAPKC